MLASAFVTLVCASVLAVGSGIIVIISNIIMIRLLMVRMRILALGISTSAHKNLSTDPLQLAEADQMYTA